MKKIIIAVVGTFFLSVAFGLVADAQMAKEGTFAGTNSYAGTGKVTALDKDRLVISYENTGTQVEDSVQGPLHGMSTHNTGIQYIEKGVGKTRAYMTWMDKDGDKILWELTEDARTTCRAEHRNRKDNRRYWKIYGYAGEHGIHETQYASSGRWDTSGNCQT